MESSVSALLRRALLRRVARNPRYSLRAFARDLGVSHAYLSQLLHGRRKLSIARAQQFARTAGLDADEARELVGAAKETALLRSEAPLRQAHAATPDYFQLELDRFHMLSEWHHLAILDLTLVEGFRPDARWVARRLGIRVTEVRQAVDRLVRLGLLHVASEGWSKTHRMMEVPTKRADEAIRRYHEHMILRALRAASSRAQSEYESRDITGTLMAIDPARLPQAKRRIQKFRRQLLEFLAQGHCTELYHLNIQLFRLTRSAPERATS